uniref:C2H2-type domain-containing protein n=1 Tax=Peronospora matthiolae TaxID=2874970 RepID=A0AAV1V4P1_9STRA
MQAMLSDNLRDPPFYLQRSTSASSSGIPHHHLNPPPPPPHFHHLHDPLQNTYTPSHHNHHHHHHHNHDQNVLSMPLVPTTHAPVHDNPDPNPDEIANSAPAAVRRPGTARRAAPSEDRPFACPVPNCGGRFHRKFTLHEHLKTHTGEQPHQCPVAECGKRFSTSGNLARHRKLHAMRKISCPATHCTRVFTSREKLVPHLKVHLARTPHTCDFAGCGKTFSTAGNLTRHRRTQHRAGPVSHSDTTGPVLTGPAPTLPRPKFEFPGRSVPLPTGSLPMRGLLWPSHAPVEPHPPPQRILESDVQDLFDCLFLENAQAAAAAAAANGHHNVAVIRDRLPKLELPRDNRPPQSSVHQVQPSYLTATASLCGRLKNLVARPAGIRNLERFASGSSSGYPRTTAGREVRPYPLTLKQGQTARRRQLQVFLHVQQALVAATTRTFSSQ